MSATLDLCLASPVDTARLAFAIQASYESSHPIILRPGEYLNPERAVTVVHAVIAKDDEGLIEHSLIRIDAEVDDQGHRVVTDGVRWPRTSMITVQVTLRTKNELSYEQLTSVISDLEDEIKRRALIADAGTFDSILWVVRPTDDDL